jgi:catechol 2,3-dioxygenase-like lactoylglutathione lyase family enzyme
MIRGVNFATIPVRDQDRSLEFYTNKLGFRIITDQPFQPGIRWIELGIPGADTRVVLFTAPGQESRIGEFQPMAFWSDDVEGTYEQLSKKGVEFTQKPKKEEWGTSAIFKDVDGNVFVLGSR